MGYRANDAREGLQCVRIALLPAAPRACKPGMLAHMAIGTRRPRPHAAHELKWAAQTACTRAMQARDFSWSLIHGNPSTPPSDDAVLPHSSARHSAARVLTVYALLVFQTLSRVSRREPSAMTAIRARDPKSWPTFCVDEAGILVACDHYADDARAPHEAAYCRSLLSCVSMIFSCDE